MEIEQEYPTIDIDVSDEEFLEFIEAQPDTRLINMRQPASYIGDCGCIMVHFGKHKQPNRDLGCSFDSINFRKWQENKREYETDISYILSKKMCNLVKLAFNLDIKNYGSLKELIRDNSL
jgi:hypothetical protein